MDRRRSGAVTRFGRRTLGWLLTGPVAFAVGWSLDVIAYARASRARRRSRERDPR